jgi:hypothetical protein
MTEIEEVVFDLLDKIARKDYDAVVSRCIPSRLTAADIARVVSEYGKTVVSPPRDRYEGLSVVAVTGAAQTWSIAAPLWTAEEGRSDLTLEVTLSISDQDVVVEIDGLHVL